MSKTKKTGVIIRKYWNDDSFQDLTITLEKDREDGDRFVYLKAEDSECLRIDESEWPEIRAAIDELFGGK